MSTWRREAIEALPELRPLAEAASSPMELWIELYLRFEQAATLSNSSQVERILRYAAWCVSEAAGRIPNDTSTAVACAFYEHLATRKDFWPNFAAWFRPAQFSALLPVFRYHLSQPELAALQAEYSRSRPNNSSKPTPLRGAA